MLYYLLLASFLPAQAPPTAPAERPSPRHSRQAPFESRAAAVEEEAVEEEAVEEEVDISTATVDESGTRIHRVNSPYQSAETTVSVLLPDRRREGERFPVVYLLPVEAGAGRRWGDPLREVRQLDLHNRHRVICVYPTFSQLPWYCDHPTDPRIRQETYFLKVVVPAVERLYPAEATSAGRRLLGFSKSGWGAWSLLLRHPETFSRAVAWDAPLMMDRPGRYGSGPIFGTAANFDRYRIDRLLRGRAEQRTTAGAEQRTTAGAATERLALLGYDNFRDHHVRTHDLLQQLDIPHAYRDGPQRRHHWNSGWLAEAFEWLCGEPAR